MRHKVILLGSLSRAEYENIIDGYKGIVEGSTMAPPEQRALMVYEMAWNYFFPDERWPFVYLQSEESEYPGW
jgi:hypothetical protein